jgi:peptidoglycan/xylan/chitin deacetylase (PgdA/CDA1 family)
LPVIIKKAWKKFGTKAKQNAFYRGIPFIWCSNNLTVSFAIQCFWYKQLTRDNSFSELEQANFDWLFGCNPWGTSMVYGLPASGDSPVDPHSSFTHLKNYPINGGLVDGPVYTSIFGNLIGIQLQEEDEYADFQSGLVVYHDDYGDYSTNEPTMDGTASLIYLIAAKETEANLHRPQVYRGGVTRGRQDKKRIALVFTGHEFADGGNQVAAVLNKHNIKASFFLTGVFYRNSNFRSLIRKLQKRGHYLGPHSDQHLLYCDWSNQDSLLVTRAQFKEDLSANLMELKKLGSASPQYFLPPYEWYNDSISAWTKEMGMQLVNYSPGTLSTADYTYPPAAYYRTSDEIFHSIIEREEDDPHGLNGFILLMHIGTDPRRTDKFYKRLDKMISLLKQKGYAFTDLKTLFDQ